MRSLVPDLGSPASPLTLSPSRPNACERIGLSVAWPHGEESSFGWPSCHLTKAAPTRMRAPKYMRMHTFDQAFRNYVEN